MQDSELLKKIRQKGTTNILNALINAVEIAGDALPIDHKKIITSPETSGYPIIKLTWYIERGLLTKFNEYAKELEIPIIPSTLVELYEPKLTPLTRNSWEYLLPIYKALSVQWTLHEFCQQNQNLSDD